MLWYPRILKGLVWIGGSYYSHLWPDPGTRRFHDGGREGAPLGGRPGTPHRGILWTPHLGNVDRHHLLIYDQPQSHVNMYTLRFVHSHSHFEVKLYTLPYISHVDVLKSRVNMYTLLIVCRYCFVHGNIYFEADGASKWVNFAFGLSAFQIFATSSYQLFAIIG